MRIEDLKRWHWCIVGLAVGAAFAFIRLAMLPKEEPGLERVAPNVFEAQVVYGGDPVSRRVVYAIENIRIHPATEMPLPGERTAYAEYLSYDVLLVKRENHKQADRVPRQMIMAMANPNDKSIAGNLKSLSLREYLDKLNEAIAKLDPKRYPKAAPFTYRVAWIETPKAAYSIYTTGGFIVIGIIWPTLLHFLVIAGYGRPRSAKDDEFDLASYKSKNTGAAKAKPGVTQDQIDQLDQLEAELEAKLREGAADSPAPAPQTAPVAAPIPILSAGPMEAPKETPETAGQRKGYGADQGDYYPTEVHGKKS
jgi:hypothetical protein